MQQSHRWRAAGKVLEIRKHGPAIYILTETLRGVITPYSDEIIRVQFSDYDSFNDHNYAVIEEPTALEYKFETINNVAYVTTKHIILEIELASLKLTFKNSEGVILSEDGLGIGYISTAPQHYRKLQPFEHFMGLGEKGGHFDRSGSAYQMWNTDAFGYNDSTDPLYASIPFFIGHHASIAYGLFYDNTRRAQFNFGASNNRFSCYSAPDGDLNFYFIASPKQIPGILDSYTWLTGKPPIPPKWSLGLQQCRYSYYPDKEVASLARTFREKEIPCDVIYLDIHYMDAYKVFTFHPERFPNPKALMESLKNEGFRVVTIVDPGVKTENHYHSYESGKAANIFLKYPDGTAWEAQVWPGWCHFPDFTAIQGREWWQEQIGNFIQSSGVTGVWNDMNEPATWGQAVPEVVEAQMDGKPTAFAEWHNVYGMQMMRSSYEGILRNNPKERPFVLTRSGYSGLQRYGAIWTGDNQATDSHMMLGIRLINSLGLSGIGFAAMDIGGFEGQSSKETYTRWIQIGAFMPMMRIHTMIDNRDQEPWALGETTESIARSYIQLRYRLLPYLYAAFEEGHRTGLPIQRSLAISFFNDNRVYDWRYENQFTCANNLLLAPIKGDEYYLKVFFPEIGEGNSWYSLWNDYAFTSGSEQVVEAPLHLLPVFAKAGAVIPMQSVVQNTSETPSQLLEWHIYPINSGESVYEHYEDDGLSYDYKKGNYLKRTIQVNATSVKFSAVEGHFESPFTHYKLVFHGLSFTQVNDDTHTAILHLETHSLIADLPNFNPIGKNIVIPHSTVKTIYVPASNDEFTLNFS